MGVQTPADLKMAAIKAQNRRVRSPGGHVRAAGAELGGQESGEP